MFKKLKVPLALAATSAIACGALLEVIGLIIPTVLPYPVQLILNRGVGELLPAAAVDEPQIVYHPEASFEVVSKRLLPQHDRGFRDDGIDGEYPYMVALGDSFTFGWGVPVEQNWVEIVERTLERDVANMANGRAPGEKIAVAKKYALSLKPKVALMGLFMNDYYDEYRWLDYLASGGEVSFREWRREGEPQSMSLLGRIASVSTLAALAKARYRDFNVSHGTDYIYGISTEHNYGLRPSTLTKYLDPSDERLARGYSSVINSLKEIQALFEQDGVKFVVLYFPLKEELYYDEYLRKSMPEFPVHAFKDRLFADLKAANVEIFDMTPALAAHADEQLYFRLDGHWTSAGNRVVGEYIASLFTNGPLNGLEYSD